MPADPAATVAALKAELAETQDAGAAMVVMTIQSMGATPEQMARLADEYQDIADGRMRSRITGIIARKVAEKLRDSVRDSPRKENKMSENKTPGSGQGQKGASPRTIHDGSSPSSLSTAQGSVSPSKLSTGSPPPPKK